MSSRQRDSRTNAKVFSADVARLINLAGVYRAQGAYTQAVPLCERALHILEAALGPAHPEVAASLNNLAMLYQDIGALAQAAPLFERALRILETTLGAEHLDVAQLLNNLAMLQFLKSALGEAGVLISFHAHGAPNDGEALALALTATLRRKGRVLAEVVSEQTAMRRNLSPDLQVDLDTLQARRGELARRRQAAYNPRHADALHALAQEVERLEAELSRKSVIFGAHAAPLTLESVQTGSSA